MPAEFSAISGNRPFQALLGIGALQSIARWLELLALGVYVFDTTRSPLLVTMVTLTRFAPLALFGPVAGALPSWFSRRSLYRWGLAAMLVTSLVAAYLAWYGLLQTWQVLAMSFVGGLFWTLDFPVRRALIGDAVPRGKLGNAMALDTIANNGTRMLGPLLGGFLLQHLGLTGVFSISVCIYFLCFLLTVNHMTGVDESGSSGYTGLSGNIREGSNLVRRDPVLSSTLLATVVYNLFGFPMLALVPVLGRDELQLSPSAIGVLASMEGAGALAGGILLLIYGQVHYYRRIYVCGIGGVFLLSMVYALMGNATTVGTALFLVGIGGACFAAMQTTLLILNSAARYRSQVFGLLSFCIGSGIIGFAQIGLLADWIGTRPALIVSASLGLLALSAVCLRWPQIIARQTEGF